MAEKLSNTVRNKNVFFDNLVTINLCITFLSMSQFCELYFIHSHLPITYNNQNYTDTYGVCGLLWHYDLHFDQKLVQGKSVISIIHCACNACTYQLDLPWIPTFFDDHQPKYHLQQYFF